MRVLLNGLTALKPKTGIGHYTAHLASEMTASFAPGEFSVYPPKPWSGLAKRLLKPSGFGGASRVSSWKTMLKSVAKQAGQTMTALHFARYCKIYGVKLYHEPNYLPFNVDVPTVITVHDLSVILHPEWHPANRVTAHARRLERAIGHAAHIITDTEQVKREVMAEFGTSAAKITAIPLGVSPIFQPTSPGSWRTTLELPDRYFLCVGTIEPRKNLLTAMKAFAALPEPLRRQCPLLLAGPWGWKSEAEHEYFHTHGRHVGIRHLGYVPDDAMPALYSGAVALLYPSRYEGFGLPPLEAVACGSVAICSQKCAAVREVMGDAALYCDAEDIAGWRDLLKTLSVGGNAACNRAANYTWRRTAERTQHVYDAICHNEPGSLATGAFAHAFGSSWRSAA